MESTYSFYTGNKDGIYIYVSKFEELLSCFADYFSNSRKGFCRNSMEVGADDASFNVNSCLTSLRIIKFKYSDGFATHMYFERKLDKYLSTWQIPDEPKYAKLIFPNVIQLAGHDRNADHEIETYYKSAVNHDPASSIGYSDNGDTSYPSKIIYNSERPGMAQQIRYKVTKANTINPQEKLFGVQSPKLRFWNKNELEEEIKNGTDKNNNKAKENEKKDENEINDKKEKEKENETGGMYLIKLILIIFGLLLIAGGVALFFMAVALALKILAIGLFLLGAVGLGFGLFYNKIVNHYSKRPGFCCIGFLTYTIFKSKEQNKENNINLEEQGNNLIK